MKHYGVIMAGGGGTRFWPLSRQAMPKQMLNLSGKDRMINETIDRLDGVIEKSDMFIVTNEKQAGKIVYTSLSAGAEEIAVLVLTDEDAAAAALDGLEARVADQKAVLESYQPDEVSKLDSAIVEQRGNSVLLAVAADAEKARAALDGLE